MRTIFILSLSLALAATTGCMTLHADLPEEVIRHKMAQEEGIQLAARCAFEGRSFSEGATVCMTERRMTCSPTSRWTPDGDC